MSVGRLGKGTNWKDDVEGRRVLDERNNVWGEINGEIVDFDATNQKATIKPLYKPKFNGTPTDMPNLEEVPVRFTRTASGAFTFPIEAGAKVSLRPMMRSTENWHEDQDGSPSDGRSFALSDMEAHLDGGESLKDPIKNFDPNNAHWRWDAEGNYGIRGNKDGQVQIQGSQGNIYTLTNDAIEQIKNGFGFLKLEPLIYVAEYEQIEQNLQTILDKLRAMEIAT